MHHLHVVIQSALPGLYFAKQTIWSTLSAARQRFYASQCICCETTLLCLIFADAEGGMGDFACSS